MATNTVLEVNRTAIGETRLTEIDLPALADGQVRLRIERFAVTANNVTYAMFGDMLGYWDFFPTGDAGWGRVPAMGWATVLESRHADIATGRRYYGWYPMAAFLDLQASATASGLRDDGAHRQDHAAVYRAYVDTERDPLHPSSATDVVDAEDRHALLRGLFATAFLAGEFLADAAFFGADNAVILSASSKTAIGLAQRLSQRGLGAVIGVTSAANVEFVRSLDWYDRVVPYDDVSSIDAIDAVAVDMSGNAAAVSALHAQLADRLKYSMVIGKSHHDAPFVEVSAGPTPEMFFAPTEVARREHEWGHDAYRERLATAMREFIDASAEWLTVQHTYGPDGTASTWDDVHGGRVPPNVGRIATMQADG